MLLFLPSCLTPPFFKKKKICFSGNKKCWRGCEEIGAIVPRWWKYKMGQWLWKTGWQILKKLRIELLHDPAISLLEIYPKGWKTGLRRDICPCIFIAALFTVAKRWKQPKCPWTDEWDIYIYEYYSAWKWKEILTHAAVWMNFESIVLNEIVQSHTKNRIHCDSTYVSYLE